MNDNIGKSGGADVARLISTISNNHKYLEGASNNKDLDEKQKEFIQQFLSQAAASMNSNSIKSGIEDIANRLKQNGSSSGGSLIKEETVPKMNGSSVSVPPEPMTISNHTPLMQLSCIDCGVTKSNSEEMEVHIKMEHLSWLPFQCPICLAERASDAQMREHLHSSHKKNMNKYIYVDNVQAKRQLQILMDKAFSMNVTKRAGASGTSTGSPTTSSKSSNPSSGRNTSMNGLSNAVGINAQAAASAIINHHKEKEKQQVQAAADFLKFLEMSTDSLNNSTSSNIKEEKFQTEKSSSAVTSSSPSLETPVSISSPGFLNRKRPYVSTSMTNGNVVSDIGATTTESLLASISQVTNENEENDKPSFSIDELNIDSSSALASLFGGSKKIKFEDSDLTMDSTMDDALDALNPISVLDNVAALFGSTPDRHEEPITKKASSSISKKRVLGECSKCQKPVTAGARQMHMFFHLAKDENIFRFRCKHENCSVEHYRKDQMENHQSKIHGRIDPDMMEDRSLELFQKCQELNHELFVAHRHNSSNAIRSSPHTWSSSQVADISYQDLSMELLGTKSGTIPGPTAAKAEIAYAAQQAAHAQRTSQKSKLSTGNSLTSSTIVSSGGSTNGFGPLKLMPDEDHPLQCRLCGKTMQNRIRGFHILWHMAKDKGINRYTCKYCEFGHDRSQSVQVHGKKEHGTDECVEDRIAEYQDDVKEMSEACFGISSLFAQESKRKNKIPAAMPREKEDGSSNSGNASPLIILDEDFSNDDAVSEMQAKVFAVLNEAQEEAEVDSGSAIENEEVEEEEDYEEEEDTAQLVTGSAKRKRRGGRFNVRSRKSKRQKEEAMMQRNISILIGGAQFYRKKVNEFCYCEKCGKLTNSRLPEHAYTHLSSQLFVCPLCDVGHQCRETVLKHMKDMHPNSNEKCIDNRLVHVAEIKQIIKECFPAFFVDHPLPTKNDIKKLIELTTSTIGEPKITGAQEYIKRLQEEEEEEEKEEKEEKAEEGNEEKKEIKTEEEKQEANVEKIEINV